METPLTHRGPNQAPASDQQDEEWRTTSPSFSSGGPFRPRTKAPPALDATSALCKQTLSTNSYKKGKDRTEDQTSAVHTDGSGKR